MGTTSDSYDEASDTASDDNIEERQPSRPPAHRVLPERQAQGTIKGKRTQRPRKQGGHPDAGLSSPISGRTSRGRGGAPPGRSSATASPVPSEPPLPLEPGSAQKRKRRRLAFSEGDPDAPLPDQWRQGAPPAGRGRQERLHGDIGEGVSALLSLASVPGQEAPTSQAELGAGHGQQPAGHDHQQQQYPQYPGSSRGEVKREKAIRRAARDTAAIDQEMAQQHPPPRPSRRPLADPDAPPHHPSPSRRDTATSFASPIKTHSALEPPRSLLLQARRGDPSVQHQLLASPPASRRAAAARSEPLSALLSAGAAQQAADAYAAAAPAQALAASIIGNQNVVENQSVFWSWLTKSQAGADPSDAPAPPGGHHQPLDDYHGGRDSPDNSGGYSGGDQVTYGRRHKRKPVPERLPMTLCAAKYAYTRSLVPAHQSYSGFQSGRQQAARAPPVGENGEPMTPAEVRLRHCLSSRVRRWAGYEFHYSAIDRPWFLRNELQEFLHHLGIAHATSLTRTEWSIIRSAFGKPRRLSAAYLADERAKLELYRDQVRSKYQEVGIGMEVPPDLPRPLRVGQEVTARHPQTRQLHDGSILTVTSTMKYRVQFARSDLLTEVVPDVDVMPVDPSENLPLTLASLPLLLNGRMNSSAGLYVRRRPTMGHPARGPAAGRAQQEARAEAAMIEAEKETDSRGLLELCTSLDVKEGLMRHLRDFHDMASAAGYDQGRAAPQLQQSYAQLVLNLQEVDKQLKAALESLRDRPKVYAEGVKLMLSRGHQAPPPAPPGGSDAAQQEATAIVQAAVGEARTLVRMHCPSQPSVEQLQSAAAAAAAMAAAATLAPDGSIPAVASQLELGGSDAGAEPGAEGAAEEGAGVAAQAGQAGQHGLFSAGALRELATRQLQLLRHEDQCLAETICSCLSILHTLQKCSARAVSAQAIVTALDMALSLLQPRSEANHELYHSIAAAVGALKVHLAAPAAMLS